MSENYTGQVVEDPETGELVLELPVELLSQMGWDEGTLLEWMISDEKVSLQETKDGVS